MATLSPNASAEEIEDELMMQQAFLDSLGDVDDSDEHKSNILTTINDLESRLQRLTNAVSDTHSVSETSATSMTHSDSLPNITGSKRVGEPHEGSSSRVKRPTLDSSWSFDSEAAKPNSSSASRVREKHQLAEEAARRRYARERADAEFAASLYHGSDQQNSAMAGPSRTTNSFGGSHSFNRDEHAPIFQPYSRPQSVTAPVKPERPPVSTPQYTTLKPIKPESSPFRSVTHIPNDSEIVDLTDDSLTSPSATNNAGAVSATRNWSAELERVRAANRSTRAEISARHQAERDATNRTMASRQEIDRIFRLREEGLQRDRAMNGGLTAYQTSGPYSTNGAPLSYQTPTAYPMPGAFPLPTGGYVYGSPARGHGISSAPLPNVYQPMDFGKYARDMVNKAGRSIGSNNLASLGGLLGTVRRPYDLDDDDDVNITGSRSLMPDIYGDRDPEEVAADLKNLMDNIRPDTDIPMDERDVEVEGMTVKLKPYQNVGLSWLQKMEDGSNKGGILADDMGLGKTVQAIALMNSHRSEDPGCKTTLIIAPVALLRQWKEEIESKLRGGRHRMSVFVHHSSNKKKTFAELRVFDVVLTTFGTLAAEMKRRERFESRKNADREATERADEKTIFIDDKSRWYRIIIDEAQNIKNRNTKSAKAACRLTANSRFCMTGTPMMNSVDELHSLIQFLRIRPYNDLKKFNLDFSKPLKAKNDEIRKFAMEKLQVLLKAILLRRHKKSQVNGKPILILPDRTVEETNPVFSEEERDFYHALETASQTQFNKYVSRGTVGKSYAHILVMLLRLRQACCHPHLIKDFGVVLAADISPETMVEYAKELADNVVNRIKEHNGDFECPVCYDAVVNPAIFVPCGHDTCAECYSKIKDEALGQVTDENGNRASKCPNCRGLIDPKKVIDYETFKTVHMPEPEVIAPEDVPEVEGSETESDPDETSSDTDSDSDDDDDETGSLDGFIVDDDAVGGEESETADEEQAVEASKAVKVETDNDRVSPIISDDEDQPPRRSAKSKGKQALVSSSTNETKVKTKKSKKSKSRKSKGDKNKGPEKKKAPTRTLAELKKAGTKNKTAKKEYLRRIRRDWTSSAKIDQTLELLKTIMTETDEKVIIFSQWTSLLDQLEIPVDENSWGYERYDGSMSAKDRGNAVENFKQNRNCRMMLISLKAGNAGLNLNFASQVIILDPFWNPFVEEQAIDRAHRLGQNKNVVVHRILIAETVEDRIIALQEKKRELINQALDEGAGQRLSRLSMQELGYLFGITSNPRQALPSAS